MRAFQPVLKKVVNASGAVNYNVLQNNGRIAHQEVDHVSTRVSSYYTSLTVNQVHFHMVKIRKQPPLPKVLH